MPAGDIGVGGREIGYLFGQYKRLAQRVRTACSPARASTGAAPSIRPEATGYGAVYFAEEMLNTRGDSLKGKTCPVSGSGNVAQYTVEKVIQLGGKAVTLSDRDGTIDDTERHRRREVAFVLDLKNNRRGRIHEYADKFKGAKSIALRRGRPQPAWDMKADVRLPQRHPERDQRKDAANLLENGVLRGLRRRQHADRSPRASSMFVEKPGSSTAPARPPTPAASPPRASRCRRTACASTGAREEVDSRLHDIMKTIHKACVEAAAEYGMPGNYVIGANIAGFLKVADACSTRGWCEGGARTAKVPLGCGIARPLSAGTPAKRAQSLRAACATERAELQS